MITNRTGLCIAAGIAAALISAPATAADIAAQPIYNAPPTYRAPPAAVETWAWNPWMIRLRALGVVTRDSGQVDQIPGSGLATSDNVVPEFDISYFFTPSIAAELILGVTRHHVMGTGVPDTNGLDVGKAWLLPPTLTFQYHFTQFGAFKPYVGAGVNYTVFFDQSAGNVPNAAGVVMTNSHLHDSFGGALQVGFDYMLDRHWGVNFDVKKLFLRPDWDGTSNVGPLTGKVNLDPWLIAGGVAYRF
jgi:outer membrane protein